MMMFIFLIPIEVFRNHFKLGSGCLGFFHSYEFRCSAEPASNVSCCPGIYVVDSHKNSNKKYNHFLLELFSLFYLSFLTFTHGNSTFGLQPN